MVPAGSSPSVISRFDTTPGGSGIDLPALVREEMMLKAAIFLGLAVIENRKIVLLQVRDRLAFAVDHHVHFHQAGVDADNWRLLGEDRWRQSRRGRTDPSI